MCLPLALGLQAASTYANKRGNKAVRRKQEGIAQAEDVRQGAYYNKANSTLSDTMAKFVRPAQDAALTGATAQRDTVLQDTQAQPGDYTPTSSDAPEVVHSDLAQRMKDVLMRGRSEVRARAKLGAYGGVQNQNAINLGRSGQDINQMADFSRGSAGIVPYEMGNALSAGRKWGQLADLFRMGGSGLATYSMMKVPGGTDVYGLPLNGMGRNGPIR
jgi:hypothetical protein